VFETGLHSVINWSVTHFPVHHSPCHHEALPQSHDSLSSEFPVTDSVHLPSELPGTTYTMREANEMRYRQLYKTIHKQIELSGERYGVMEKLYWTHTQ